MAALVLHSGQALAKEVPEFEVKAAYLFNFAKFVEWPDEAFADDKSPMVFAVVGEDPFGALLEKGLANKTIAGRQLLIRRFETVEDVTPCHVLFISKSERSRVPELLRALRDSHTLTVSDVEDFTSQGGICRFLMEDRKVRFEINLGAAQTVGLKVSPKLLKIGKVIQGRPIQGSK